MQRYNGLEADDEGVYVLHEDATKRIAELTSERDEAVEWRRELMHDTVDAAVLYCDLMKALEKIAQADGCGCTPPCQCDGHEALRVWKDEVKEIATAAIAKEKAFMEVPA